MPGGRTRTSDWIEYKQAHCKSTFSADFYLRCENEVVGLMGKKKRKFHVTVKSQRLKCCRGSLKKEFELHNFSCPI